MAPIGRIWLRPQQRRELIAKGLHDVVSSCGARMASAVVALQPAFVRLVPGHRSREAEPCDARVCEVADRSLNILRRAPDAVGERRAVFGRVCE